MKLVSLFLVTAAVRAACPNGCSGQGDCIENDSCSCYANFLGGDCSLRQCPTFWSWLTTPQGDLNYDGDRNDASIYDSDHRYTATSVNYLNDQLNPGGTWESWPSFFSGSNDEGHFYMECANRGICNRKEGQCECFPGYTGVACRRTMCPEDCSGHGQCQTVGEQSGSFTYELWDQDMSRSCVCDPGWSGPACASRPCPVGDDPLTTGGAATREIQWVDIFTDDADDSGTDGPFSGSFTLSYTDFLGKIWVTDDIAVSPWDGETTQTRAADVEEALEALPNNAIRDATVTEGACETVIPGDKTIGDAAVDGLTEDDFVHFKAHTTNNVVQVGTGDFTIANSLSTYTAYPDTLNPTAYAGGAFTGTVYKLSHANCIRFKIEFTSNPGDLPELTVDTSKITVVNQDVSWDEADDSTWVYQNTAQGATTVGSAVVDALTLGDIASAFISDGETLTCAGADVDGACSTASGSKVITVGSGVTHAVHTHDRIQLLCGTKEIGTYTVSGAAGDEPDTTTITLLETPPVCDGLAAADGAMTINVVSNSVWVDGDLTSSSLIGGYVLVGALEIGPISAVYWQPSVSELLEGGVTHQGRLIIDNDLPTGYTTYAAATTLKQIGSGGSESSECSDRGTCDTDSGLCKCFLGYTGNACSIQNSLSA